MKGVMKCITTSSIMFPGLIKPPLRVSIAEANYSLNKKLNVARPIRSLSCKGQLSPFPTTQPSKLETPHHETLLKSLFIHQGDGEFKKPLMREDIGGMLSLYDASYLGGKGEDKLLEAMEFARSHLKQSMPFLSPQLRAQVAKALEVLRHLRMMTSEARKYVDEYSQESNHNPALLELAKLEFSELQSIHKKE